jgi:hypothetical protein
LEQYADVETLSREGKDSFVICWGVVWQVEWVRPPCTPLELREADQFGRIAILISEKAKMPYRVLLLKKERFESRIDACFRDGHDEIIAVIA